MAHPRPQQSKLHAGLQLLLLLEEVNTDEE